MLARRALIAGMAAAVVAGATPAGAAHESSYAATSTKLFMRTTPGTTCGTRFLAFEAGTGEPSCGSGLSAANSELYHLGLNPGYEVKRYSTVDPVSILVDATRNTTGNVRVVSDPQTNRYAIGQLRVDVTVLGKTAAGTEVVLGTSSSEKLVNPTNSAEVDFPFTVDVKDELDRTELRSVTVVVDIRGWHVLTGYHRLNGQSWLELATYERTAILH